MLYPLKNCQHKIRLLVRLKNLDRPTGKCEESNKCFDHSTGFDIPNMNSLGKSGGNTYNSKQVIVP